VQKNSRKFPLSLIEIVCLAILTPIIYICGFAFLVVYQERLYPHFFEKNPYGLSYFMVLGFDVAWVMIMVKWGRFKNVRFKIVLTWLVLILSSLVLTDLYLKYLFDKMW
jgi:hypothetical protein